MRTNSIGVALVITLMTLLPWQAVRAQDYDVLLNEIRESRATLEQLVQQERSERVRAITRLQQSIDRLVAVSESSGSEADQLNLVAEIALLRAELADLKSQMAGEKARYASLDGGAGLAGKKAPQTANNKKDGSKTTVNGRLYSHAMVDMSTDTENYNEIGVSRAYVTLKSKLSDYASLRITSDLRMIDDKYNIILKYAYLDWKPGFGHGSFKTRMGLQATQYIDQMNKLWARRYVEKTVGDQKKFLTSSDLGISTIIGYGQESKYGYVSLAMFNGTSYSGVQELNSQKDFNVFTLVKPLKNNEVLSKSVLMAQFYTGTQNKAIEDIVAVDTSGTPWDTTVTAVTGSDWKREIISIAGLLAWNGTIDAGVDANFTTVGQGPQTDAVKKSGMSFFGTLYLKKLAQSPFMKNLNVFGRVDLYDPNTGNDNDGSTSMIMGVESVPVKGFKVALNYRSTSYEDSANNSLSTVYVNTLFKF